MCKASQLSREWKLNFGISIKNTRKLLIFNDVWGKLQRLRLRLYMYQTIWTACSILFGVSPKSANSSLNECWWDYLSKYNCSRNNSSSAVINAKFHFGHWIRCHIDEFIVEMHVCETNPLIMFGTSVEYNNVLFISYFQRKRIE